MVRRLDYSKIPTATFQRNLKEVAIAAKCFRHIVGAYRAKPDRSGLLMSFLEGNLWQYRMLMVCEVQKLQRRFGKKVTEFTECPWHGNKSKNPGPPSFPLDRAILEPAIKDLKEIIGECRQRGVLYREAVETLEWNLEELSDGLEGCR